VTWAEAPAQANKAAAAIKDFFMSMDSE